MQRAAPADFSTLKALLIDQHDSLPKRLKQVAEFALSHSDDMAFGTVASIAAAADVQPSTLVRFAQTLGYSGFSALQDVFRKSLRGTRPDYKARVAALLAKGDAAPSVHALLEGFSQSAHLSLDAMRASINPAELEAAVLMLKEAHTLYIVGMRRAFAVSTYLSYALGKLGIRSVLVDGGGHLGPEQLAGADKSDALIAISFSPYSPETVALVSQAQSANVPILALTDSGFSPLVRLSTHWLEVAEADFNDFRSLAATFVLAMTLAVAVAEARA